MKLKSIYAYVLLFFMHISLTLSKERRRHNTRNSLRRNLKTNTDRKLKKKNTDLNSIRDNYLALDSNLLDHHLPDSNYLSDHHLTDSNYFPDHHLSDSKYLLDHHMPDYNYSPDHHLSEHNYSPDHQFSNHNYLSENHFLDPNHRDHFHEYEDYINHHFSNNHDINDINSFDPHQQKDITISEKFHERLGGMNSLTEKLIILNQTVDYQNITTTLNLLDDQNYSEDFNMDHIHLHRQLSTTSSKWKNNWMTCIKDDTLVKMLKIPGTHDSGSKSVTPTMSKWAKTQDLNILEQLEAGIRYLDLRTSCRDEEVRIYHGIFSCYETLEHISYQIKSFFERSESAKETLIIDYTLEQEHDNLCGRGRLSNWFWGRTTNIPKIYKDAFDKIHDKIFKLESSDFSTLAVNQVRGKIILLQDIGEEYPGTYMKGNPFGGIRSDKNKLKTFHSENLNVQDDWDYLSLKDYTVDSWTNFNNFYKEHFSNMAPKYSDVKDLAYNAKRSSIVKLMNSVAHKDNKNRLNINYFSFCMIPFAVKTNVQRLNSILLEDQYIETMPESVYVFDFPKENVIKAVVLANSSNFSSMTCVGRSKKKLHRHRRSKH